MITMIMMALMGTAKADKVCNPEVSKPCGNACISKEYKCSKAPGTARWPKKGESVGSKKLSEAEYSKAYGKPPQ